MTKRQHLEHRKGNQLRKRAILELLRKADPALRNTFNILGGFQNGKFTPQT